MYRLVFHSGRYEGKSIVVRQAVALVGRDPACHLVLPDDDQVAARHLRLEIQSTGVHLTPLAAGHPVRRNGEDLPDAAVLLAHGDMLEAGRTRFQFQTIVAPHRRLRPSPGFLQPATVLAALGILALEVALLAFLVDWPARLVRPETEAIDIAKANVLRAEEKRNADAPAPKSDGGVMTLPGTAAASSSAVRPAAPDAGAPQEVLQVLQQANFAPADTNLSLAVLPQVSAADARIEEAQRMLAQATAAAEFADFAEAFRLLGQIHQMQPGFLPAHVQHARLLEARGDLAAAMQRWSLVVGSAPDDSPFREQALRERARLEKIREAQTRLIDKPPVVDMANLPRQVRIASSDVQRLPPDSDVAEMRVLTIELAHSAEHPLPRDAALQVFVTFYDLVPGEDPRPTGRAIATPSPILLASPFAARPTASVEATYVVPRGLRAAPRAEAGAAYYGYAVHVFAGQTLQDAFARPRRLLERPLHMPSAP